MDCEAQKEIHQMYEVELASEKTCEAVLLENLNSISSKDEHLE